MNNFTTNSDEDDDGRIGDNEGLDSVIFTSDDEHDRNQLQPQPFHRIAALGPIPGAGDVDDQSVSPDQAQKSSTGFDPPGSRPKLGGVTALSLVSYTIDDDDDEEENQIPSDSYGEPEVENDLNDFKGDNLIADVNFDTNVADEGGEPTNQLFSMTQTSVGISQSENMPFEFSTFGADNEKQMNAPPLLSSLKFESYQLISENQTDLSDPENADRDDLLSDVKFTAYTSDIYVLDANPQDDMEIPTETLTERLAREVTLPPEPPGLCRMELQEKVDREVRRMRLDISYDPNRAIQDNKAFRNPSIYEKLISFLNIDEKGTNFPPTVYNPYRWSSQSYYDELARVQNREIDRLTKLQQQQKQKKPDSITQTATAIVSGNSVLTGYTEPKKRSKWDAASAGEKGNEPDVTIDANPKQTEEPIKGAVPPVGSLIRRR